MNRLRIVGSLALVVLSVGGAVGTSEGGEPAGKVFAHNVYFALNDASPEAREALVDACERYLSGHDGATFFAAGTRVREAKRDVNDTDFDVSLHIHFEDAAAHAVYQEHPRHKEFIGEMSANWKAVRVFDSWVTTGS
jgi:hypothetical protein